MSTLQAQGDAVRAREEEVSATGGPSWRLIANVFWWRQLANDRGKDCMTKVHAKSRGDLLSQTISTQATGKKVTKWERLKNGDSLQEQWRQKTKSTPGKGGEMLRSKQ